LTTELKLSKDSYTQTDYLNKLSIRYKTSMIRWCVTFPPSLIVPDTLSSRYLRAQGGGIESCESIEGAADDIRGVREGRLTRSCVDLHDKFLDIIHSGPFNCMRQAKAHGDILVIGVIADDEIRRCKGPSGITKKREQR
jgi:hypothetical protein